MGLRHASAALALASAFAAAKPVDFSRDIRPILSDNCFQCHGPDEKSRIANLRLDTREGALAKIKPGDADASPLYQRIVHADKARRMPPAATGRSVTEAQAALVKRWIDEGARWTTHWSYLPPARPAEPRVKKRAWVRNAVDSFVLAKLEEEGLAPSPEADRATLLRRVTFDLTGLPPTRSELAAFLADKSPKAYERAVDRLLESSHYGEKMALHWLDLARYADSHGYHIDPHRDMWPWRDWVIQAFNRNMPFDRFTVEQLAGDLLPNATREQKLATGFNRNHMINFEGGAIPEEYQIEYVIDRVEATANVWMGMTMGCARCHDHKYDPISQRDFYRFFAFFNTIPEKGLDGTTGNAAPFLFLGEESQQAEMDRLRAEIKRRKEAMKEKEIAKAQAEWEKGVARPALVREGIVAHWEFDGALSDSSGGYRHARTPGFDPSFVSAAIGKGLSFGKDEFAVLGDAPGAMVALWVKHQSDQPAVILRGSGVELASVDVEYVPDRKLGARIAVTTAEGRFESSERIQFERWTHLAAAGGKLWIDGKSVAMRRTGEGREATGPLESRGFRGQIDDVRVYSRVLRDAELESLAIAAPLADAIEAPLDKRSREQKERVREHFLTSTNADYRELKKLEARLFDLEHTVPSTMVMEEMKEKPRESFVLGRGDYRNKGDKVTPAVPSALPQLPAGAPANRLGLAQWLTSPDHPLMARVTVNRFWQNYFGIGLVKTSEDFGSQGESPAHAALLDWLATEFVRTGWDVKAMQRLIVTSTTYRQSSRVPAGMSERDPENRLFARMSRFRLPAELVRDNALAVSGLINREIGGRSVLPYQPGGLWEEMAFGGAFTMQNYKQSHGSDLYRRSMYTFWKRTVPPAQMASFDAPDREKCTSRRPITNTPLQALILMNDPTYVESARRLAERILREGGARVDQRLGWAWEEVLARKPAAPELALMRDAVDRQTATYRNNRAAAEALLRTGEWKSGAAFDVAELAAWTNVASMLLQLDETVTKE